MMARLQRAALLTALLLTFASNADAWTTYATWTNPLQTVYVNPANGPSWMSRDQIIASVMSALNDWTGQGASNFQFIYGGTTGAVQNYNDGLNTVSFATSPHPQGVIAFTYCRWDAALHLSDCDTVLYPPYQFFADDQACPYVDGNVVLRDMLDHEFGHMLGLNHSADPEATMYGAYYTCSTTQRTLAADDIAGVQSLYGVTTTPPDPGIPPPPITECVTEGVVYPLGAPLSKTLKNGQAGLWITAREGEGWVLVGTQKVKAQTTITMQCGPS